MGEDGELAPPGTALAVEDPPGDIGGLEARQAMSELGHLSFDAHGKRDECLFAQFVEQPRRGEHQPHGFRFGQRGLRRAASFFLPHARSMSVSGR